MGFLPKLDALLFFDYKSIEPCFTAYYMARTGDESMAKQFREGIDPYVPLAEEIGLDRQDAKQLFLSQVYGGGRATVGSQLGVSRAQAGALVNRFHKARPGLRKLQNRVKARLETKGYIYTLWGRRLHPLEEHKALNALIQGCAADLMRSSLVKVHKYLGDNGYESHLVSTIHDEAIVDAVDKEIPYLVELIPELMKEARVEELVPIRVDVEWSRTSWGEKEDYA